MYVSVCMYVCMYVHACMYACMYINVCMFLFMYVCFLFLYIYVLFFSIVGDIATICQTFIQSTRHTVRDSSNGHGLNEGKVLARCWS